MRFLNNLKLNIKLIGSFLFLALILAGLIAFNIIRVNDLGRLQDAGAQRSFHVTIAEETQFDSLELYQVIADAQINNDFSATQTNWDAAKKMTVNDFALLKEVVDTTDERNWYKEGESAYNQIVNLFETEMLPALKKAGGSTDATRQTDAKIDTYIKAMNEPLLKMVDSFVAENVQGDKDFDASRTQTRFISIVVGILAIILAVVVGIIISQSISYPIKRLVLIANSVSQGDLVRDMDEKEKAVLTQRKDEVGDIAKSFDDVIIYLQGMGDAAKAIAKNDLTAQVTAKSEKDELGTAFVEMTRNLRVMITQVLENATALGAASSQLATAAGQAGQATSQIATTVQQVAKGTTEQTVSITKTAAAVEQMTKAIEGVATGAQEQSSSVSTVSNATERINSAIQQVAGNAARVTSDSAAASEAARKGSITVEQTLRGMQNIKTKVGASADKVEEMGKRSEEIGKIVETIQDIASQTNLLALNAAIEAARAGEHGKGFAVVADEVRKLAERSSLATKEIDALINGILTTVAEAVKAMEEGSKEVELGVVSANAAGSALNDILEAAEEVNKQATFAGEASERMKSASDDLISAVDSVSAIVEENTASTEEMTASSTEVSQAIESIASVSEENSAAIEQVSASTEEMSAQVEEVNSSASTLSEMARELQDLVAKFKI
jgi:methyl-accepting chemotaxis protein